MFAKIELAKLRYETCKSCDEFNSTLKTCKLCGCFMPAKTALKSMECPKRKWPNEIVSTTDNNES